MAALKLLHDSVVELPEQTGVTSQGLTLSAARPEHADEVMPLEFALAPPKQVHDDLEARVAKGDVVPPAELASKYGVPSSEVQVLVKWLEGQGFKVTSVTKDGTSVYAEAPVAQIERSLGVNMVRVTKGGLTYTAARNAPSLPADIAGSVHAILGLQPFRHAHKHLRKGAVAATALVPKVNNKPPYLVPEILKAYDADALPVTGKGQTIAILIDCFPLDSDLTEFWQKNGVAGSLARIAKVNLSSGSLPAPEGEETLDVSWTSGIAPDATIRIYATGSLQFTALNRGLDQVVSDLASEPGMRQLSISMGLGETFMAPGEVRTQHQKFLRLAAAGVNVFISSGDAGSNPDSTGQDSDGPLQAEYSSSDTCVIGVGGTTLVLSTGGTVAHETGWTGSGGGKSKFFPRPAWQTGAGVASGTQRLVPDISLTADPNEGVFLILNGKPFPEKLGGTSWSAPVWAGFCALMNEARINAGKPALSFLNPVIYPLMGSSCFRDIVAGSNGAYDAGVGYDMVTGIGVPSVRNLTARLTS